MVKHCKPKYGAINLLEKDPVWWVHTDCLRKKYGVVDSQYFKNGTTQQCTIFRQNKCNSFLVVCEVSTPYVKRN